MSPHAAEDFEDDPVEEEGLDPESKLDDGEVPEGGEPEEGGAEPEPAPPEEPPAPEPEEDDDRPLTEDDIDLASIRSFSPAKREEAKAALASQGTPLTAEALVDELLRRAEMSGGAGPAGNPFEEDERRLASLEEQIAEAEENGEHGRVARLSTRLEIQADRLEQRKAQFQQEQARRSQQNFRQQVVREADHEAAAKTEDYLRFNPRMAPFRFAIKEMFRTGAHLKLAGATVAQEESAIKRTAVELGMVVGTRAPKPRPTISMASPGTQRSASAGGTRPAPEKAGAVASVEDIKAKVGDSGIVDSVLKYLNGDEAELVRFYTEGGFDE